MPGTTPDTFTVPLGRTLVVGSLVRSSARVGVAVAAAASKAEAAITARMLIIDLPFGKPCGFRTGPFPGNCAECFIIPTHWPYARLAGRLTIVLPGTSKQP